MIDWLLQEFQKAVGASLKLIEGYDRAGMSAHPICAAALFNASFVYVKLNDLVRARQYAERSHVICSKHFGPEDSRTKNVQIRLKDIHELELKNPEARRVVSDSRLCSNCNKVSCLFGCAWLI